MTLDVPLRKNGKPSRWFPPHIRLARDPSTGLFQLPAARVTAVVERASAWRHYLGPLDGVAQSIIDGNFSYPRASWSYVPSWKRNHPSWEQDDRAKESLGPTIANWLFSGVLEYVPPDCNPPLVVEPVGAVPKSSEPWFRLITDARVSNKELGDWPVRYWTVLETAASLRRYALMCADDAKDAYHLSAFAGCTGHLVTEEALRLQPDGTLAWAQCCFLGCSPRTCLGTCDKARSGICLDGFLFRFAAAQFGQKLAGSPLNALLLPVVRHLVRRFSSYGLLLGLICSLWVDDLLLAQNIAYHGLCAGLSAGCAVCAAAARLFACAQQYWHQLASALGIILSLPKRQEISQRAEYSGIVLDTVLGRFFIPDHKLSKLRACLQEFRAAFSFTFRGLASVRGRVQHYSLCIMYLRPLVPLLFMPMATDIDFDFAQPMQPRLHQACDQILHIVDRFAHLGAPMWPSVPSSLYGQFLRHELLGIRLVIITWDSSVHGWAALICWWANYEG